MNGPSEEGEEYRVHNQTDKEERAGGGGKRKRGVCAWNMVRIIRTWVGKGVKLARYEEEKGEEEEEE